MHDLKSRKGYTLVELLFTLAICATLIAISIPVVMGISSSLRLKKDHVTALDFEEAIVQWTITKFDSDTMYRDALNDGIQPMPGVIDNKLNGISELKYTADYAGNEQLPGLEFASVEKIRHAAITAIKSTSVVAIRKEMGEQFLPNPTAGSEYGYKYYYKLGRVTVEKISEAGSILGSEDVYKYYVWLSCPGGVENNELVPKKTQDSPSTLPAAARLFSFSFIVSGANTAADCTFTVESGGQTYTLVGSLQTPQMFGPGKYTLSYYYKGVLQRKVTTTVSNPVLTTIRF